MPLAAPRACGLCGGIHAKGTRCPKAVARHQERKAVSDKKRPSARARGYDREWEREAKAFLSTPENRLCQCGAPAVLVAHKQSIRQRPDLRMVRGNWRPSCQRCNAHDAARERQTKRKPS